MGLHEQGLSQHSPTQGHARPLPGKGKDSVAPGRALAESQPVQVIGWADYRYRISIRKEEVLSVLIGEISGIEYTSFKNSCKDEGYLRALVRIWSEMQIPDGFRRDEQWSPLRGPSKVQTAL